MSTPIATQTGEQLLELLQIVARLDQLGMDGEVRVRIHLGGGTIEIHSKSARAAERGS